VSAYAIASNYAQLGDKDQTFDWLEIAYKEHNTDLIGIISDYLFNNIRSDPRYTAFARKIGLPES